jgi:hypothetical protein
MSTVVDLAQILAAPVAGLLGVGIGYVGQSKSADKRLAVEQSNAREGRLFDHRRLAYEDFLTAASGYFDAAWQSHYNPYEPDPDEDAFLPLWKQSEQVAIYGTRQAADQARHLAKLISNFGYGYLHSLALDATAEERARATQELQEVIQAETETMRDLVRTDLGVD